MMLAQINTDGFILSGTTETTEHFINDKTNDHGHNEGIARGHAATFDLDHKLAGITIKHTRAVSIYKFNGK
jgi:hypothetical protein